jgi:beta-glucosidase
MMAHGAAVQAYRATGRNKIGLVVNIEPKYAASQSDADCAATRRAEAYMNRQYLEPALLGSYPEELHEVFGEAWPQWPAADLKLIKQPLDYIGVNYYTRAVVRSDPTSWPLKAATVKQKQHTHMETGWEVYPQGLVDTLLWIKDKYGNPPVYITENGACFFDPPQVEGPVLEDPLRVDYLRKHITAVHTAMQRGADIRGYFAWSLFDNFEWAFGFSKRFGIVHMNYETLKRTLKSSAHFYSKVIASNGAALTE